MNLSSGTLPAKAATISTTIGNSSLDSSERLHQLDPKMVARNLVRHRLFMARRVGRITPGILASSSSGKMSSVPTRLPHLPIQIPPILKGYMLRSRTKSSITLPLHQALRHVRTTSIPLSYLQDSQFPPIKDPSIMAKCLSPRGRKPSEEGDLLDFQVLRRSKWDIKKLGPMESRFPS